jgi:hypothetical protein
MFLYIITMSDLSFKIWMEARKDIFGFEKEVGYKKPEPKDENPINRFNIDLLIWKLSNHDIGEHKAHRKFVNECQWGDGLGSLRLKVFPDLHTEIARKVCDLHGHHVWVTKKLWMINRDGYGGHEEMVGQKMLEELEAINKTPVESVNREFDLKDLERIVHSMASRMRTTARDYFMFEGIRKLSDKWYIIRFNLRGQGVEAPDQRRVIENQTMVFYDEQTGKIRVTNKNIETNVGGHAWEYMPSDLDVNFVPTQPEDEMNEVLATTMRWY